MAAIEAHLLIIRPDKCLDICIVTILGWRTKGGSAPLSRILLGIPTDGQHRSLDIVEYTLLANIHFDNNYLYVNLNLVINNFILVQGNILSIFPFSLVNFALYVEIVHVRRDCMFYGLVFTNIFWIKFIVLVVFSN